MTTPTQAQIEAALKAFYVDAPISANERMSRALTATAEVGNPPEPYIRQPGDPAFEGGAAYEAYQKAMEYCDKATIERCAQVAENWKQGASTESKGIAAAIRALKDKP